ncbi:hypothetical protein D9M71_837540 [compost metagenome]
MGGAQLLTALGKLVTFDPGNFVGELLDDGLVAVVLLAHPVDLLPKRINLGQQLRCEGTQLVGGHLIEIGRGSHALDFTSAGRCGSRPRS